MDKNIEQPYKENPVLLDRVIQELRDKLLYNLPWLNKAFGRAYKIVEYDEIGGKRVYPAAYIGNAEYVSLMPNDNFGNFSWLDIYDPQTIQNVSPGHAILTFTGGLVFWYNLDSIFVDNKTINSEDIKNDILKILASPGLIQKGRISIISILERPDNIYKDYSLERVYNNYAYKGEGTNTLDKQFFMYPYCGIRFEFEIKIQEICS